MCGIAGIIVNEGREGLESNLECMLKRIVFRGPDQQGTTVINNRVALGMSRLSIVDNELHDLPYFNEDTSSALVFNGEIYNHKEIRRNLNGNHRFKTASDTETVLHAFEENGVDCLQELNGMYAFAYYDKKTDRLYLVRDKAGEKPVYFCKYEGAFYFASEIKALLAHVKPELNDNFIGYKSFEICFNNITLFKNIFALQPGEYLVYENGDYQITDYWKIWDQVIDVPDDEDKIADELAELIEDAVLLRTNNLAYPHACFISGGVDSSIIACISKPAYLYTAHYPFGKTFDELEYARMVADQLKMPLNIVYPSAEDFERTRKKIAYHLDLPTTWTSFTIYRLVEEACKNVKVILSGEGADEAFGGYHRYHLLHNDQQIFNIKAMEEYTYLINKYYGKPEVRYARLINRAEDHFDDETISYLEKLVNYYFDKALNDVVHGMGIVDFYTTMQVLLQMEDRMCMAFSVENRSPFLDHRVIRYAFSMSSKYKIYNGCTKYIFKKVAKKIIPKPIAERIDKRGFSAPVNVWFGWDKDGKYDRSSYRKMAFNDWKNVFFH